MDIKIVNTSNNPLPAYATSGSACMDLRADLSDTDTIKDVLCEHSDITRAITILPGGYATIPTGIHIVCPEGYYVDIRPRSGLATKDGITIVNSPGTGDCDYTGELHVCLINHGQNAFVVNHGDRIAQFMIVKYEKLNLIPIELAAMPVNNNRGNNGLGHSGVK